MSDLMIWNELGNIYFKIGSYEEAAVAFQKAIQDAPNLGWPYSNLGLVYSQQGKYTRAVPLYRKSIPLLKSDKEKAVSWNRLGDAYRRLNAPDKAMAAYQKAVELDVGRLEEAAVAASGEAEALPAGKESQGPESLPETATEEDMSEWLSRLEVEKRSVDNESGAVDKEFQEWLKKSPVALPGGDTRLPAALAVEKDEPHYWVLGTDVPKAQKPASRALVKWIPVEPRQPDGPAGQATGARDGAADPPARFKQIVKEAGAQKPARQPREGLPDEEQDVREVQRLVHAAVQKAVQGEPEAANGAGTEYAGPEPAGEAAREAPQPGQAPGPAPRPPEKKRSPAGNLDEAVVSYTNITQNSPKNDRAWDALGNSLRALGRYDEAIEAFEQAVSLAPNRVDYYYHLGLVYTAQKRHEDAIGVFKKVVQLNPDDALAHGALAGSYRRMGREAEAVQHIRIAQPTMAAEREYNRACFEAICGNADRAVELLKIALETKQTPVEWMRSDPDLEPLHDDPRFKTLVGWNDAL